MKRSRDVLLVVLVSLLPFVFIFTSPLLPHTSDGGVHLPRMGAYFKALLDGHFPVRWAGDLNYGYGLPLFNFMYHTPYLISSLFIALGIGLVTSFKLTLALSFVFSGISMYLFTREWLGDRRKALWITLFYQFAPFRIVEILVRGSIGGIYAYAVFPLVLWGIVKIRQRPSLLTAAITASATALLIISHNALSLIFFGVSILFTLFFFNNKKTIVVTLGALLYGLLMSAFYWVPAIFEHKYTYGDLFMKDLYKTHFPPLVNFFQPNFINTQSLRTAEISVQLGLFHVIAIALALWGLVHKKFDAQTKKIIAFGLGLTAAALFFMHPVSYPLWQRISFLRQFQFPWRFLALTSFSTSLIALAYTKFINFRSSKLYVVILFLVVATTAWYWYPPQGFDQVNEKDFWNYPLNTTYFGETDVIWSAGPAKGYPAHRIEFAQGAGMVENFTKKTQTHTFTVTATAPATLVDHTQYFPGWRVYVDGQKAPIEFQDQNWRGLVTFPVPPGRHAVRVVFEESKLRIIADIISGVAVALLALGIVKKNIRI